jgi:hypothetical protein
MAESYPLALPTVTGIAQVRLIARDVVAISASPFTFTQQTFRHQGQRWEADISLPPLARADADVWASFLLRLRGQHGTFLLGDPSAATPRGSASITPGTPLVNGASQTGDELDIDGLPNSVNGYLKAGDYIQLGSAASATLHKVLEDVNSNASGEATLNLWPGVKTAPSNNAAITVINAKGVFRLAANETSWDINNASIYGITFGAVQAI